MHDTPPDAVARRHFVMQPGDVLYIPRGVSHVAATTAESPSLHITFAVHAVCWEHFMRFLFAPGGAADKTTFAPFQLGHHSWGAAAADALTSVSSLPAMIAPLKRALKDRFVACKASKTGGKTDITVAMALQWWLHDVALLEPSLRATYSWYWPQSVEGGGVFHAHDRGFANELGKRTFSELIGQLRSRAPQLEALVKERMKALGCSAPSEEAQGKLAAALGAALEGAEGGGDGVWDALAAHARAGFQLMSHSPDLPFL